MQRVFIDESGVSGCKYLVIGSIWIHDEAISTFEKNIAPVLDAHFQNRRELKWTKVTRTKLAGYLGVVDSFVETLGARFRCIVLDTHKMNHQHFNSGDSEIGYHKFLYQLITKNIRKDRELFGVNDKYLIFHDSVPATIRQQSSLAELKRIINNSPVLITNFESLNPVRDIQPIDSKESLLVQTTDILTGAVRHAFEFQGNLSEPGSAKRALIEHIQEKMSIKNLGARTSYSREKFNIWEFELQEKAKPPVT